MASSFAFREVVRDILSNHASQFESELTSAVADIVRNGLLDDEATMCVLATHGFDLDSLQFRAPLADPAKLSLELRLAWEAHENRHLERNRQQQQQCILVFAKTGDKFVSSQVVLPANPFFEVTLAWAKDVLSKRHGLILRQGETVHAIRWKGEDGPMPRTISVIVRLLRDRDPRCEPLLGC